MRDELESAPTRLYMAHIPVAAGCCPRWRFLGLSLGGVGGRRGGPAVSDFRP